MYVILEKMSPKGSWRVHPRLYDDKEKAEAGRARNEGRTPSSIFKIAYLGDQDDWK